MCNKDIEQAVRNVMHSIMENRSAVFSKTDLTKICNKIEVRDEAVKRLAAANLLLEGNNFWIEPSRAKIGSKRVSKRSLRYGCLKSFFFNRNCLPNKIVSVFYFTGKVLHQIHKHHYLYLSRHYKRR